MDLANWFMQSSLVDTLGGALVHFLWQGAVAGILLALALRLHLARRAEVRYVLCCAALLIMLLLPVVTVLLTLFSTASAGTTTSQAATYLAQPVHALAVQTPNRASVGPLLPWFVAAWMAGVALLSVRVFGGWLRVRSLTRQGVSTVSAAWSAVVYDLARKMGVTRSVTLLESACAKVPAVIGCIKPVILMPASVLTGLSAGQIEALFAHELAHIRRYDYLVNLLQTAVETLLFYHPAVWWTSAQMRTERENCCDDLAVRTCGDALTYARALAEAERLRSTGPALAMAATGGSLLQRIRRVTATSSVHPPSRSGAVFALLIAGFILIAGAAIRPGRAQDPAKDIVQSLFAELHDRNWVVEGDVKVLLEQIRTSGNTQPFVVALKSRADWQSREKAAWVLGMVEDARTVADLAPSLKDESPAVRHTVAWALGMIGNSRALDALIGNLKDSSSEARAGAVWALGRIGDPRSIDALLAAVQDSASDVRAAAAWSLGMIGDPRAASALTVALQDASYAVRQKAGEALDRLRR